VNGFETCDEDGVAAAGAPNAGTAGVGAAPTVGLSFKKLENKDVPCMPGAAVVAGVVAGVATGVVESVEAEVDGLVPAPSPLVLVGDDAALAPKLLPNVKAGFDGSAVVADVDAGAGAVGAAAVAGVAAVAAGFEAAESAACVLPLAPDVKLVPEALLLASVAVGVDGLLETAAAAVAGFSSAFSLGASLFNAAPNENGEADGEPLAAAADNPNEKEGFEASDVPDEEVETGAAFVVVTVVPVVADAAGVVVAPKFNENAGVVAVASVVEAF
jgi:hypothetical protein